MWLIAYKTVLFVAQAWEVQCMNLQENRPNGGRGIADNILFPSSKLPLISGQTQPKFLHL